MNDYEEIEVVYFAPKSVTFSASEIKKIHKAWQRNWGTKQPVEEMTEEDILTTAKGLGLVDLPEDWKV